MSFDVGIKVRDVLATHKGLLAHVVELGIVHEELLISRFYKDVSLQN
jgi:hypothetical protein